MTATDATITTAIPEVARVPIPVPSKVATTAVASQDAANLHAKEGTTPVVKKTAVAAKPAAKAAAKVSAKAGIPAAQQSAAAARPMVKSVAKLPAEAATTPVTKKTKVAAKPASKAVSKMSAKPTDKAAQAVFKPAAKPILKATPKASVKQAVSQKTEKVLKEKKPKLVRDSFTIPKAEYTVLDELKHRAGKLGSSIKKSELIRAGIKALAAMSDAMYLSALNVVPKVKTGRPSKK